jgi:flagellar protein FlaG
MSTILPSDLTRPPANDGQQSYGQHQPNDTKAAANGDSQSKDRKQPLNNNQLHQVVHGMNQKLANTNLKVEFAADQPVGDIWLNVVDNETGKVIQKLPPDSVRKAAESLSLKGLQIDQQR